MILRLEIHADEPGAAVLAALMADLETHNTTPFVDTLYVAGFMVSLVVPHQHTRGFDGRGLRTDLPRDHRTVYFAALEGNMLEICAET